MGAEMRCLGLLAVLAWHSLFSDNMKQGLERLYPKGQESFAFVDAGLKERELFSRLKVNRSLSMKCIGALERLHDKLTSALTEIGNTDMELVESATNELVLLTQRVLDAGGHANGFVIFRAFIPNDLFATPRWHMDGNFYHNSGMNPPKFVITLKGSGTLFQPSNCSRECFTSKPEKSRKALALFYSGAPIQPKACEGAFFIVGNLRGAVHSEPNIAEERIFFSVMGATEIQIQEMIARGF